MYAIGAMRQKERQMESGDAVANDQKSVYEGICVYKTHYTCNGLICCRAPYGYAKPSCVP